MSTRYHINPETGRANICRAQVRSCPVGGTDGNEAPHFDTKEEARAYVEKQQREIHGDYSTVKKTTRSKPVRASDKKNTVYLDGDTMHDDEARQRLVFRQYALKRLEEGVSSGAHVYEDEMSPEMAAKKMEKSLDFASSRGNTILMRRLSNAVMMPSGVVKSDKGRYDANEAVQLDVEAKHLADQRKRVEKGIKDIVAKENPPVGTYAAEVNGTKASVSVRQDINKKALAELEKRNPALYQKISKEGNPKYTKDSLLAAGFTEDELEQLKTPSAKYDLLVAEVPDTGQQQIVADTNLGDGSVEQRLERGAKNLASLVDTSYQVTGRTTKERSAELTKQKNVAKAAVAAVDTEHENESFFPARKHGNGGLVSWSHTASYTRGPVEDTFKDDARLKKALITERSVDRTKAEKELSAAQFNALYSNKAVTIRVTEPSADKK